MDRGYIRSIYRNSRIWGLRDGPIMFALRVWVGFGASWKVGFLCYSYSFVKSSALGDHKYLDYISL